MIAWNGSFPSNRSNRKKCNSKGGLPFFKTSLVGPILDRNVRKFWLNGSCLLFQFRLSFVDCSFPL